MRSSQPSQGGDALSMVASTLAVAAVSSVGMWLYSNKDLVDLPKLIADASNTIFAIEVDNSKSSNNTDAKETPQSEQSHVNSASSLATSARGIEEPNDDKATTNDVNDDNDEAMVAASTQGAAAPPQSPDMVAASQPTLESPSQPNDSANEFSSRNVDAHQPDNIVTTTTDDAVEGSNKENAPTSASAESNTEDDIAAAAADAADGKVMTNAGDPSDDVPAISQPSKQEAEMGWDYVHIPNKMEDSDLAQDQRADAAAKMDSTVDMAKTESSGGITITDGAMVSNDNNNNDANDPHADPQQQQPVAETIDLSKSMVQVLSPPIPETQQIQPAALASSPPLLTPKSRSKSMDSMDGDASFTSTQSSSRRNIFCGTTQKKYQLPAKPSTPPPAQSSPSTAANAIPSTVDSATAPPSVQSTIDSNTSVTTSEDDDGSVSSQQSAQLRRTIFGVGVAKRYAASFRSKDPQASITEEQD